jgi:hypothetical protein
MSFLKAITPGFLSERYWNIQSRLKRLENEVWHLNTAIDAMLVRPEYAAAEAVAFNGQRHRKKIFGEVTDAIAFDAIVETGTWLGDTTGYMRQTANKPVYSCEHNPRYFVLAGRRLKAMSDIFLELNDSRQFLRNRGQGDFLNKTVFFYLDAHWDADLPLGEEVDFIAGGWKRYVILVDDFQVPDDPGYGFDNYGEGKALDLKFLEPAIRKFDLKVFFPSARSSEETAGKCGSVVLAPAGEFSEKLSRLLSLRKWE